MLREIEVRLDGALVEPLSEALLAAGALAVSVSDADVDSAAEQPLYGEPGSEPEHFAWPRNVVVALLGPATDPAQVLARACADLGVAPPPIAATRTVHDADWVRLTQSQFAPTRIVDGLWIVPTWHTPPEPAALNIRLDPGAAFGTGTHPTTRLCLRWLARNAPHGCRVLDYGCGSGILAIAASRLGASEVIGTDIDPQALLVARANSTLNHAAARYTDPDDLPPGAFDLVLANILTNPLKVLARLLLARVALNGHLVLSGVLAHQASELIGWYSDLDPGLSLAVGETDDGWVCLAGTRR